MTKGLEWEPYEARYYSLLGAIAESSGETINTVERYYDHALKLDPVDARALLRQFAINASRGETIEALRLAEAVFRAWPGYWENIEPFLPTLLSSEVGYDFALARFRNASGRATSYPVFACQRILEVWI